MLDKSGAGPFYEDEVGSGIPITYVETLDLIERLHLLRLELIKDSLRREGQLDLNPIQALLLFRIGHKILTPSEIRNRGYCQGSNVFHHVKKLIEADFLSRRCEAADRRCMMVSLTRQGASVFNNLNDLFSWHADQVTTGNRFVNERLEHLRNSLKFLEDYLSEELSLL